MWYVGDIMINVELPFAPLQAAKTLLSILPAKRMRDVLERRFGLKGGEAHTLEAIGRQYKITRERVRQIEFDALRRLALGMPPELAGFFDPIENAVRGHGEVMAERHLYTLVAPGRYHPHLRLLLTVSPRFNSSPESDKYHSRWAVSREAAREVEASLERVIARLGDEGRPVSKDTLHRFFSADEGKQSNPPDALVADAHLGISKLISQNPYGEYGLISWPAISPRGIKDKAYAVLNKAGSPMHFRDVASAIDRAGWSKSKKAHPQTVHNELIKDERFILVGRGLYALQEWGYEPGTVRQVLISLLKSHGRALEREEIVRLAAQKRLVKPQTILLNLQDRSLFKRTEDGKYTLL